MRLSRSLPQNIALSQTDRLSQGGLRVGMLSNRNSGKNKKYFKQVERLMSAQPRATHFVVQTPKDIAACLRKLSATSIDVLVINGGDGTVAATLTSLLQEKPFDHIPPLLLLPGGTTNMTAADCGVRGNLMTALRKSFAWATDGEPQAKLIERPILSVQAGTNATPICGMFFGAGVIIQGIEYCHTKVHRVGISNELGPGLVMLRTLWGVIRGDTRFLAPVPIAAEVNGASLANQDVMLLLVSTLERLFLGMRPYWGAETAALHFSMIRHRAQHLVRAFPSLLRGRPNRFATQNAGYVSHNSDEVHLLMDSAFTLDGELYQAESEYGPVIITSAGPLKFILV